jgi:sensor c-di-GMP phosphodiesterase-like protein
MSLAHAMGLHVVAEGVETQLQASQLLALGCTVAQGFLWSPAVPAAEIDALEDTLCTATAPVSFRGERSFIDEMLHQIGIAKEEL